jgi:hypothetical protein
MICSIFVLKSIHISLKNDLCIFEVFLVNPAGINVRIGQVFYYKLRILGSLLSAKEIENNTELQIE